ARLGYASAAEALGKEIEGMQELITDSDERGELRPSIVGVVKDFHYATLHEPIEPLVLFPNYPGGYAMVKIDSQRMAEGLSAIEEAWHEVNPEWAFEYFFVEDTFAHLHEAEQRFGRIFISFSALAVVIACLGLVGLSSFTAERRRKEIGVRKVLGASASGLVALLSREYFRLVIAAIVVAWPVAYLAMNAWLEGFAYRVDLDWPPFVLAGVLAMAIALLTVSFQAVRAATANPVEVLRME
ncbi:MAG: FtsX-like permease family protein, partial [bacterium]|nr:FtsX-like permease family protein [bacterium]